MTLNTCLWENPVLIDLFALCESGSEISMYTELALRSPTSRNRSRILELGVGTGRVLLCFDPRKFELTGIDQHALPLETLRRRADQRGIKVNLFLDDIGDFQKASQYDFVYCPAATLNMLGSHTIRRMCGWVARALIPEGIFSAEVMISESPPEELERYQGEFEVPEEQVAALKEGLGIVTNRSLVASFHVERCQSKTPWHYFYVCQLREAGREKLWEYKTLGCFWRPSELVEWVRKAADPLPIEVEWYEPYDLKAPKADLNTTSRAVFAFQRKDGFSSISIP